MLIRRGEPWVCCLQGYACSQKCAYIIWEITAPKGIEARHFVLGQTRGGACMYPSGGRRGEEQSLQHGQEQSSAGQTEHHYSSSLCVPRTGCMELELGQCTGCGSDKVIWSK